MRAYFLILVCTPLRAQPLVEIIPGSAGLQRITGITHAGDSRLFLCEQEGRIRIYDGSNLLPTPFLNISTLVESGGNEQGLLGLAFHPQYAQTGFLFVHYTRQSDGASVIARYHVSANPNQADPGSAAILMTVPQPWENHNAGELQFGPDGYLYIGMGDGGSGGDPDCRAQKLGEKLGKLLRVDVDQNTATPPYYAVPASNPFVGLSGAVPEIWALGLRNPWRFSFDRLTGDLFIGDVGQDNWEEIDFEPAGHAGGRNYGWKIMEGNHCHSSSSCPDGTPACNAPSLVAPIIEYSHGGGGCSVTGGYRYRGCYAPSHYGAYFYSDWCAGELTKAVETSPGVWSSSTIATLGFGLTTFGQDAQGELYLAMASGPVYRLQESLPGSYWPYWHTSTLACTAGPMTVLHLLDRLLL